MAQTPQTIIKDVQPEATDEPKHMQAEATVLLVSLTGFPYSSTLLQFEWRESWAT